MFDDRHRCGAPRPAMPATRDAPDRSLVIGRPVLPCAPPR
jgi:hypothetical protein